MANVLKGEVLITAPGVKQVFDGVANGAVKAEGALKRMGPAVNSANLALINTGRIVQDLPFGFLGIANNLNPLLESFQRLKAQTGSSAEAMKALKSSLLGAGGLGFALSVASSLLISFGDKLFGAGASMSRLGKVFADAKDQFVEATTTVSKLTTQIELAREGFISKEGVVKAYNDTIGKTTGLVSTLDEAEKELTKNGDAYIQMTLKKAVANIALGKAAEAAFKIEQNMQRLMEFKPKTAIEEIFGDVAVQKIANQNTSLQKQVDSYRKMADDALKAAAMLSKAFGFNFFGDTKAPKIDNWIPKFPVVKAAIPMEFTIDFAKTKFVLLGGDIKTLQEQMQENINKDIEKLVVKVNLPRIDFTSKEQLEKMWNNFKAIGDIISSVVTPAIDGMFDAIKKGGNIFKAFATAAGNALLGLISKLIQTAILAAVLSALTGGIGGAGIAKGVAGFKAIFNNLLGFRASGGPVQGGGSYVVGERGPELFVPNTGGRIIPNDQMGGVGYGGGMKIEIAGEFVQRGQDLIAVLTLANQSKSRLI